MILTVTSPQCCSTWQKWYNASSILPITKRCWPSFSRGSMEMISMYVVPGVYLAIDVELTASNFLPPRRVFWQLKPSSCTFCPTLILSSGSPRVSICLDRLTIPSLITFGGFPTVFKIWDGVNSGLYDEQMLDLRMWDWLPLGSLPRFGLLNDCSFVTLQSLPSPACIFTHLSLTQNDLKRYPRLVSMMYQTMPRMKRWMSTVTTVMKLKTMSKVTTVNGMESGRRSGFSLRASSRRL